MDIRQNVQYKLKELILDYEDLKQEVVDTMTSCKCSKKEINTVLEDYRINSYIEELKDDLQHVEVASLSDVSDFYGGTYFEEEQSNYTRVKALLNDKLASVVSGYQITAKERQ